MKKLLIIFIVLIAAACSKVSNQQYPPVETFFKNAAEVTALVRATIQTLHLDGALESIDRVSYLHSGQTSYAFVFYSSSKGSKSLVVKKDRQTNLADGGATITVCQDGNCDCKVKAILHNDGSIDVGCSCSTCKMVTTVYASLETPENN